MFEAFDQLNRSIIYMLMLASGLHHDIVTGYLTHLEQVEAVGFYANGCGTAKKRQLSVPQGCPWSMAALSRIMRVWIVMVGHSCPEVSVRILADDMLVLTFEGD
eukprot:3165899-Alexandrium_andersonii.AAC.1